MPEKDLDSKLYRELTAKGFLGKSDAEDPKTNLFNSGIMLHSYKLKFSLDETELLDKKDSS